MSSVQNSSTLASAIWTTDEGASRISRLFRLAVLAFAGSAFLALSAQIAMPMWPVPMTMQTFAVLLIGAAYGWRLGGATLALYLAEGALGLPVFANGGSLASLVGPTAGYLFAFVAAAAIVGFLAEKGWDKSPVKLGVAMLLGNAVIYAGGLTWLAKFMPSFELAVAAGMTPFLIGDLVKLLLAVALLPMAWKLVEKFRT